MSSVIRKNALFLFLVIFAVSPVFAESIKCTECGMMSDLGSKFTSKITEGEKVLYFCDIGDLLTYLNKHKQQPGLVEVKDYASGAWISAQKASYVSAPKKFSSPMGWGIAAFLEKKDAGAYGAPLDFDAALRAVK